MEALELLIKDTDPSSWEVGFRDFVQSGKVAVDNFLWSWIWHRIDWPEVDYSLFHNENIYIKSAFLGINVLVKTGDNKHRRFVHVALFESNPYHPDFEEVVQVEETQWRFPSIGNPFIDQPNYKWWEKMLFCKLLHQALADRGGMDFLIEQIRR
jgi:hypothetical protein